jgi:pantothenate kinase, type III
LSVRSLLLDAGNTRLKWAVIECDGRATNWLDHGASTYEQLDELAAHWRFANAATMCHGVTVANRANNLRLQKLLADLCVQPHWLHASATACGVRNQYRPPASLGADRWAALIGARRRSAAPSLVVSVGTALTVDALHADGSFAGGVIVPGLRAMRDALAQTTAQVGEQFGSVQPFPDNTADAVATGLYMAIGGTIIEMFQRLAASESVTPSCLLHGGDADALIGSLPFSAVAAPNLVLEGVCALAREPHP